MVTSRFSQVMCLHTSRFKGAVQLPSSPQGLCHSDRFSLTDFDTDTVPSWSIIQAVVTILPKSTLELIDQLATISITVGGSASLNFTYLRGFLLDIWDDQRIFSRDIAKMRAARSRNVDFVFIWKSTPSNATRIRSAML
jgi:hypothetical protein